MGDRKIQSFKKLNYQVGVHIHEGRQLVPKDEQECKSYVVIKCVKQYYQTDKKLGVSSVVWNQPFTFEEVRMNLNQLETSELVLTVVQERKGIFESRDFDIGSYSVGLSTLYRRESRELRRQWLQISKPESPNQVTGYLQVTCFIVEPGGKKPVHSL